MTAADRLTLAAGAAVLLASSALGRVYDGLGWLLPVVGAVVIVAAAGSLSRRAHLPVLVQPVVGALALAAYTVATYAREGLAYAVVPTPATVARIQTLIGEGLLDVEALAPPVPTSTGLVLLAVLGIGAVALVVDLIAVALDRPAAAGLPLLLVLAVPSATLPGGVGWLPFALGAAGWLGLLLVEGGDRVSRWGMPLRPDRRAPAYDDPGVGRVGRRIGAAALGVAVVVPALVPGLDSRLFGNGDGIGFGGGSRTTTTYNPITQLGGQLRLPVPRTLLTYRTDDPTPDYLRLTTLDLYDGAQWSSSELKASRDDDAVEDGIPDPVGLDTPTDAEGTTTEITIASLDGPWLPVGFPTREVDLDGPWLWDAEAETVFSTRRELQDLQDPYRVVTHGVDPGSQQLRSQGALPPQIDPYVTAPEVTDYVRQLTNDVVAGQPTPYDQVVALQAFFTDRSNGFRYSEASTVPGTEAADALENFLRGREGFCEQYASAMAAMARVLGLPARVGVGFTPGTPRGGGVFEVTTDDAHAWPEVWFPGEGWLRFEPTPRGEQVTTPGYTQPAAAEPVAPGQPAAPAPAPATPLGPDGQPLSPDGSTGLEGGGLTAADRAAADEDSRSVLGWLLLGVLALGALVLAPLALAALRRRQRWRTPTAAVAWQQVRDDAVDVGHRWRAADSPRAAAASLQADRQLPAVAAESLDRLARAAERERYARPGSSSVDAPSTAALRGDSRRVREALLAGASPRARWTARLLPGSTLRWAGAAIGGTVADLLDRQDEAFAALGRRLHRRPRRA